MRPTSVFLGPLPSCKRKWGLILQGDEASIPLGHFPSKEQMYGVLGPSLVRLSFRGPRNLRNQRARAGGTMARPANSPFRGVLPVARVLKPTGLGPHKCVFHCVCGETVWVWATAIDSDRADEGPQPRRELSECVREPKTYDINQEGEKNDFMSTVD